MGDTQRGRTDPLDAVTTERTLRDVLPEVPVDAVVPAGWTVGTEVVAFGGGLPADGVTLRHPSRPRDLLITGAGADGYGALAVYERDRSAGRRTAVAAVAARGDDRETLEAALVAAGRVAERIGRRDADALPTVADREATASVRVRVGEALRSLRLY